MKLLLTGATGFVGRNLLLKALAEKRYDEIILPVRSPQKLLEQFQFDGFDAIPPTVRLIVGAAPDWNLSGVGPVEHVVHSAGVLAGRHLDEYVRTNVEGTSSLLRQLEDPKKIVVLSSLAAAGPCGADELCKLENGEPTPVTWYGHSKLQMERMLAREFAHLPYVCLRPPMVLGARDQASLPLFKMVRGPVRFKPGFRSKHYSFIGVGDLVNAIFAALDGKDWDTLEQRIFFVGHSAPITDRELIASAAVALARKGVLLCLPQSFLKVVSRIVESVEPWRKAIPNLSADRAKEIWPDRWVISSEAFQKRFGWRPTQDIRTVLKETGDWYVRTGQL